MYTTSLFQFFYLAFLLLFVLACSSTSEVSSEEQIARTHCGNCHAFPEPDLLDRATWQSSVLPQMALRMGIAPANVNDSKIQQAYYHLTEAGLYPRPALISTEDWEKIKQYYLSLAPDSLTLSSPSLPITSQFTAEAPKWNLPPAVTSVFFHPGRQQMLIADHTQSRLLALGPDSKLQPLTTSTKVVSHMQALPSQPSSANLLVTYLGENIRPEEAPSGAVAEVYFNAKGKAEQRWLDLPDLPRTTQALAINLIGDTVPEILTCSFGYLSGRLSYWQKNESGKYEEQIIQSEPGALRAVPYDTDQDGDLDLLVLWGQGNERLSLYVNQGNGTFTERVLQQFPSSYGSSYFELADFDDDDQLDILYTCGDNADYSPVLKPYHGVYVFRNVNDFQLEKSYFFPMNGAYRAIARDFDQDGDQDIAAVSFFADYARRPEEGFVYLEQLSDIQFEASTAVVHELGRWITLDAGDLDQDGDLDIVLGNCSTAGGFDLSLNQQWKEGPPYVILENRHKPS